MKTKSNADVFAKWDDQCPESSPRTRQRCIRALHHQGEHTTGETVPFDGPVRWGAKHQKEEPFQRGHIKQLAESYAAELQAEDERAAPEAPKSKRSKKKSPEA